MVTKNLAVRVNYDSAAPPFATESFDYISCQYCFHHVRDKEGMLQAVFRILRAGGRFIMTNICPREMPQWLYYQYFPEAYELDLQDFLPWRQLQRIFHQLGFVNVEVKLDRRIVRQPFSQFAWSVRQRIHCSQLIAISDEAYMIGMERMEADLQQAGEDVNVPLFLCFLTLLAEKV